MTGSLSVTLDKNSSNNRFESGASKGEMLLTVNTTGAGGAPNVLIYQNWMDKAVGVRALKGIWDSALYEHTESTAYPLYYQIGGVAGIGSRNSDTDNALTGFIKLYPSRFSTFFAAWQMGVPDGRYFSGASTDRTFGAASNLKMGWVSDQPLDNAALADVVCLTRNSSTTWSFSGNQTVPPLYNGGAFDWNVPNGFMAFHKPGSNPFTDNGLRISAITTSAGTSIVSESNRAIFQKLITITPTVQNLATYQFSINGVPITPYVSGSGATLAQILNGIVSATNASTTAVVASNNYNNTAVVLTPPIGTEPILSSPTANLSVVNLAPSFTQFSTLWQGNNNQANCLHVIPYEYFAIDGNAGNAIALGNNSLHALCTDICFLNPQSWSDTVITAKHTKKQRYGKTHWLRFLNGVHVESGVLV